MLPHRLRKHFLAYSGSFSAAVPRVGSARLASARLVGAARLASARFVGAARQLFTGA